MMDLTYSILKYFMYDILHSGDETSIVYHYIEDCDVEVEIAEYPHQAQVIASGLTQLQAKSIVDELNRE